MDAEISDSGDNILDSQKKKKRDIGDIKKEA